MRRVQTGSFGVPEYDLKREGTYRPKIQPDQLRKLWLLKQKKRKAITKLVREAIELYLASQGRR